MGFIRTILAQPRWRNLLFIVGLVTAIWITYWPSLDHVPRADQWAYLIDVSHCRSLGELWTQSYSYNRVRAVGPGDADLFRPVLFAILVVEKHLFGNWFLPCQVISLLLHTAIVWMLFLLLNRIAASGNHLTPGPAVYGWLPYALTTFFALNFASMELVVWAHLHGYLLFLVFVLGSLLLLHDYLYRPDFSPRRLRWTLAGCWLSAALSAFTYELGQFFGVLLGLALIGVVWRSASRRSGLVAAACFLAILPIYQMVNHWDRAVHRGQFAEEFLPEKIHERALSLDTLEHTGRFVAFTAVQPFFPSVTGCWYQGERIHIQEPVYRWVKYLEFNVKLLLSYGIALLFFGFTAAGLRRFWHRPARQLWPMFFVPAALFALYAGITVLGRMNLRSSHYILASNSYYTYLALLFILLAAFTLWQALAALRSRSFVVSCAGLCGGLVFLAAYSSGRIWHTSERVSDRYANFREVIRNLEAFIEEHRDEPDFRLAFDMRPDDPLPVTHSIPSPLVLYPQWIDNHEPKYVVSFAEGRFTVTSADEWRRLHPGPRQLFPDLVRVGTDFNLWRWHGTYYGTLYWDDVFRPDLKTHSYVIAGATIQEVLDQVPVRHEEFMEDLRTGWCIPPRLGTRTIDEDYAGFELVEAGAFFYAVPAAEGPFHHDRWNARRYTAAFLADDPDTLRRYVDEHTTIAARK